MADFRLFSIKNGVTELAPEQAAFERELQALLEKNMTAFFGVTFLKTEYKKHTKEHVVNLANTSLIERSQTSCADA